ncbi:hypothetical protein BJY52DRAFT_1224554 [Lactarius psammicola]|nr:hypothetical protein BJY52DRAFT_1224554 [Lactarius psammicola]
MPLYIPTTCNRVLCSVMKWRPGSRRLTVPSRRGTKPLRRLSGRIPIDECPSGQLRWRAIQSTSPSATGSSQAHSPLTSAALSRRPICAPPPHPTTPSNATLIHHNYDHPFSPVLSRSDPRCASTLADECIKGFRLGLESMLGKPTASITAAEEMPLGTRRDGGAFGKTAGFGVCLGMAMRLGLGIGIGVDVNGVAVPPGKGRTRV